MLIINQTPVLLVLDLNSVFKNINLPFDCRQNFHFGTYISKKRVAFSDPTPDGKRLATEYTGTSSFLVYKYG